MLMPLLIQPPVILHPSTDLLRLKSSPESVHPLQKKLELHICLVSGKNFHNKVSPKMQCNNNSGLLERWNKVSVPVTPAEMVVAYCKDKSCNILSPPVVVAFDFLATLFHSNLSYSSINTARSAMSSILQVKNNSLPFGQLPIVQRFTKGILELRPSFPKYTPVWDLKTVKLL